MSCRRRIVYQSTYQRNPDNCILYASQSLYRKLRKDKLPNPQTKTEVYTSSTVQCHAEGLRETVRLQKIQEPNISACAAPTVTWMIA